MEIHYHCCVSCSVRNNLHRKNLPFSRSCGSGEVSGVGLDHGKYGVKSQQTKASLGVWFSSANAKTSCNVRYSSKFGMLVGDPKRFIYTKKIHTIFTKSITKY